MKEIEINIKAAITMFVIAMGIEHNKGFNYKPKLPNCFSKNLFFKGFEDYADFSHLSVHEDYGLEVWFINKRGGLFWYPLEKIRETKPLLFTAIVTHIYDMIENLEDEEC
jgi:hypothetical protein